jgi:predicted MPP superfamily phosphohydrolase
MDAYIGLVTAASTGVDLVITLGLLLAGWPFRRARCVPRIDLPRIVAVGVFVSIAFCAKALLLHELGVNRFGMIRLAYADLAVILPVAGAVTLAFAVRRRPNSPRVSPVAAAIAVLVLPIVPLSFHATCIEPFRLQLETPRAVVPAARAGREPIRIGVLADIQTSHITDYERSAVDRIMALSPDIIFVPGDLWQGTPEELKREWEPLRELLGRLSAPGGVYYVYGNCDHFDGMREVLAGTPVHMLRNEIVQVTLRDRRLTIGGIDLPGAPGASGTLERLEEAAGDEDIRILLTHVPDAVLMARPHSRIDLIVAGHTHGGQICLPFHGPLVDASSVPKIIGAGGLHELDGRRIYVSRGVGHERGQAPCIRFLCPPEITLITLTGGSGV